MTSTASLPRLLVVDDEEHDIELLREAMQSAGVAFEMHTAADGEEALRFLRRENGHAEAPRPDLVLLDLNMPRMDGRETLQAMKKDPLLRRIPVIIFSTSSDPKDVMRASDLYANAYITKPFEFSALQDVARSLEAFWIRTAARVPT